MDAAEREIRIGVPYRTRKEELRGDREITRYLEGVRAAGGTPVPVSLALFSSDLKRLTRSLDGVVLSGSPSDVNPSLYNAETHSETAVADPYRETTDYALIENALSESKPILGICYGIQILNVFSGGTLVQDIRQQIGTTLEHDWESETRDPEPFHTVQIEHGSLLEKLAGKDEALVNSSHHQSLGDIGKGMRPVAWTADGVVEAVEWNDDTKWITGVQWHPERMVETDGFARALFSGVIEAARERKLLTRR